MSPIIHIGYPKTATTWFQKSIFPNISNFKLIPKETLQKYIVSASEGEFEKFIVDYKKLLPDNNFILSDEDFITNKPEHISPIEKAKRLQKLFPNAQIILFIRNQPDIIASAYSQHIKAGGTLNPNQYIETLIQSDKLSLWKYDKIIEIYQNLFGKSAVNVFLYESINQPDFLLKFFQQFKFQLKENNISKKLYNKHLCPFVLSITRALNHFTKHQLYTKFPPKSYYFHVPLLFLISRINMNFLNTIFCFSKHLSPKKIIGKENIYNIQEYFKLSNKRLINDLNIKEIVTHHYPI